MTRKIAAWLVHLFTASGAIIAIWTLIETHQHNYINALWLMGVAIFIDAVDGTLARMVNVKQLVPQIDGALLDNIVDYMNYVITPCFFLWVEPSLIAPSMKWLVLSSVILASAYQFTQDDAKTEDHFFKGFPCYWNLVVMYLYLFSASSTISCSVLLVLSILVFIPIKYVYPSRLDYLTTIGWLKVVMSIASFLYGMHCIALLYFYPKIPLFLVFYSMLYITFYLTFSILRTIAPAFESNKQIKY